MLYASSIARSTKQEQSSFCGAGKCSFAHFLHETLKSPSPARRNMLIWPTLLRICNQLCGLGQQCLGQIRQLFLK
jgi:hypothetical protein